MFGNPCDAFSYVPVFTTANIGYGNYNAFVAKVTTKGWHGFQARASYTYSKALDNASSAGAPLIPGPLMTQVTWPAVLRDGQSRSITRWAPTRTRFRSAGRDFQSGRDLGKSLSTYQGCLTAGVNTTGAGQAQVTPYTIPQDPYNFLRNDYGRSDFDQTNRFILEYTWEIPTSKPSRGFAVAG